LNVTYMLDTNTVSYIVKGKSRAARLKLARLRAGETACISSITVAEIQYGLAKRPISAEGQAAIEGFLLKIRALPWGLEEADAYGTLRAKLEASGRILESMDLLIAAHALAAGARLVTHDAVFKQVKELGATVDWATDL
jgi:tRNA(fMet)-specific endonuclease VapC